MASREQIRGTIKHRRLALGVSQEAASESVGVSRLQWIRWEKGTNAPSDEHRPALARFLGVPDGALMLEVDTAADDPMTRHIRGIVRQELERLQREQMCAAVTA